MDSNAQPAVRPDGSFPRAHAHARDHLESLGYDVLDQHYRSRFGACDLIAGLDGRLLFVEVRADHLVAGYEPDPMLGRRRRLRLAASAWLAANPQRALRELRFDVIRVYLDRRQDVVALEHWPNVF